MKTDHIHLRNWIATLRRKDTLTEHRIPVEAIDCATAAISASIDANQRFSELIKIEVLE